MAAQPTEGSAPVFFPFEQDADEKELLQNCTSSRFLWNLYAKQNFAWGVLQNHPFATRPFFVFNGSRQRKTPDGRPHRSIRAAAYLLQHTRCRILFAAHSFRYTDRRISSTLAAARVLLFPRNVRGHFFSTASPPTGTFRHSTPAKVLSKHAVSPPKQSRICTR